VWKPSEECIRICQDCEAGKKGNGKGGKDASFESKGGKSKDGKAKGGKSKDGKRDKDAGFKGKGKSKMPQPNTIQKPLYMMAGSVKEIQPKTVPEASKRPAEQPAAGAPAGRAVAPRKESWNPWAEARSEETVEVDAAQADLQDFLKGAPRPGEDWEMDDDEEEAALPKGSPQGENAGLLGGVLGGTATAAAADTSPEKVSSIASLLASLPKPTGSSD